MHSNSVGRVLPPLMPQREPVAFNVVDFGIAQAKEPRQTYRGVTKWYGAPELISHPRDGHDLERADVFSFGTLLF